MIRLLAWACTLAPENVSFGAVRRVEDADKPVP